MPTKEKAPAGADTTTPYFTVGKPEDSEWMDPTGNYAAAMQTNKDAYTTYMAAMTQQAQQAGSAVQQVPAYAMANYNPVTYNNTTGYSAESPYPTEANQQYAFNEFIPSQVLYSGYGYSPQAESYDPVTHNPNASMNQFMGNANQLSGLVSGEQSALNNSLNQLAAYNARQSGEAALAAMPGLRNSGAAAAAFGEAYGNEYTKALAQQQQNQLNLTGNLWNQSMANASAEQQMASQLGSEQGMYRYGQDVSQRQFQSQLGAQEKQFGYSQMAAQELAASQLNAQQNQFQYNAAEEQRQYAYNQAVQQGQFGAQYTAEDLRYKAGFEEQQAQYLAGLQQQAIQNQLSVSQNREAQAAAFAQANLANYSNMAANQGWVFNPTYEANQYYGMDKQAAPAPATPAAPTTQPTASPQTTAAQAQAQSNRTLTLYQQAKLKDPTLTYNAYLLRQQQYQ